MTGKQEERNMKNSRKDQSKSEMDSPDYWKGLINNGLSKFYILKILYEGPSHGYGILKKLADRTEGCCIPTVGTIYPILKKFTAEGYTKIIEVSNHKNKRVKKVYALSPKGRRTYKMALEAWRQVIPFIHQAIDFEYKEEKKFPILRRSAMK
jgi:PadR family transcriptional regulator PadR